MPLCLGRRKWQSVRIGQDAHLTVLRYEDRTVVVEVEQNGRLDQFTLRMHGDPVEVLPGVRVALSGITGVDQGRLAFWAPRSVAIWRSELRTTTTKG